MPISTFRARCRNSRWITIGTATAAAAARNPRWMKPSPAKFRSQSDQKSWDRLVR